MLRAPRAPTDTNSQIGGVCVFFVSTRVNDAGRSTRCNAARRRNGREYCQRFQRGRPTSELESSRVPRGAPPRTGTRVRFLYDAAVFAIRCAHT